MIIYIKCSQRSKTSYYNHTVAIIIKRFIGKLSLQEYSIDVTRL